MMNYFRRILLPFRIALITAVITVLATSCTEVDDTLGQNLIPENQEMSIRIDTISNINTYLTRTDSIPSSNIGRGIIGSQQSTVFGTTTAGAMVQFTNYGFKNSDHYGFNPVADSIKLSLNIRTYSSGNSDTEQTFYVYEVTKKLPQDTLYYPSFNIDEAINVSSPLFSFTHKGKKTGVETKKLTSIGTAGTDFMKRMVDADTTIYSVDSLFRNTFKGFYIKPAPTSNKDAVMFAFDLMELDTELVLYAHNGYKDSLATVVKDTITQVYYMVDGSSQYTSGNLAFSTVQHDYTNSQINPANFTDTLPNSQTLSTVYVQAMVGATTYMRFTEEFVNSMKAKITDGYKSIVINKALLVATMAEYGVPYLNAAPARLGMYYKYKGISPMPIPDYAYTAESSSQNVTLPYGGYLNRTKGYYSMDITSYVQRMLDQPSLQRTITLAPSMDLTRPLGFGEVVLKGAGSDNPMKVVLTYTLIK